MPGFCHWTGHFAVQRATAVHATAIVVTAQRLALETAGMHSPAYDHATQGKIYTGYRQQDDNRGHRPMHTGGGRDPATQWCCS